MKEGLKVSLYYLCFPICFYCFVYVFILPDVNIDIYSSAKSADYRDNMGEFDEMGLGRGRVSLNSWLNKLYMMIFAVSF